LASWGQAVILLLAIILLGIVGKNYVVAAAAGVLLALRLLHGEALFPILEKNALNVGIGIITLAILIPFANGGIGWSEIHKTLASPTGLVALAMGIFVAYLGGRGGWFPNFPTPGDGGAHGGHHCGRSLLPGRARGAPHRRRYGGPDHGTIGIRQMIPKKPPDNSIG
jgi:uncharacterized membrane protein (DUF441 family)